MPWQDDPIVAPWRSDPAVAPAVAPVYAGPERRTQPRVAHGVVEAGLAGLQASGPGLVLRGRRPDLVLDPDHAKWYEQLAATAGQMLPEIPEMVVGSAIGAGVGAGAGTAILPGIGTAAGIVAGGGAGTFALPTLIRESLMQAYEARDVQSSGEFLSRTGIVIKRTAKDALVGALTFGAGKGASVAAKAFGPLAAGTAEAAASTATMTVAPALLDGRLPEPSEFLNAAILVGGGKGAIHIATKIRAIYARTGVPPIQVVADAAKDPKLAEELKTPIPPETDPMGFGNAIPEAYKPLEQEVIGRLIVPGDKAEQVRQMPFVELPDQSLGPLPTDVNFKYINSSEDVKIAIARIAQVWESDTQIQRRGTVEKATTLKNARALLDSAAEGTDLSLVLKRKPGTPAGDAEIVARGLLMERAAEEVATAQKTYLAEHAIGAVTEESTATFLANIERAGIVLSEFLGARAELARGFNAIKYLKTASTRAKAIQDALARYQTDPVTLAKMLAEIDTPEGMLKLTRDMRKVSGWEKFIEAWKAGILSGPLTSLANVMGNTTFLAVRVPVDILAGVIQTARTGESAHLGEALAGVTGMMEGTLAASRATAAALRTESFGTGSKGETVRPAIEGKKGEIIRIPFRALSAQDMFFRVLNQRGESHRLAFRQALKEDFNPQTSEFRNRMADIIQNPTKERQAEIEAAGDRFTFNLSLGKKGQVVQNLVRTWNLELFVPFIRTPGNIAKELFRMTPAAPAIAEWRADIAKGGIVADKAIAELTIGSAIAGATFMFALDGNISGAGDPDPNKKRIDLSVWQPYSIKLNNKWYSYQRLAPIGTLMGMAADMTEILEHMTPEERDKIPKMIGIAFANSIKNQTFLQGITNIINAMQDFARYGPQGLQTLAGSVVPAFISQGAQLTDPYAREINSMLDAIKFRVPIWRETLLAVRDPFGELAPGRQHLFGNLPIGVTTISEDPVRLEASRLRIGAAKAPTSAELPAAGQHGLGRVELTPEQQDIFSEAAGHLAYSVLSPIVNSPTWELLPDLVKRRIYEKTFERARKVGMTKALPIEQRVKESERIRDVIMKELAVSPQ